MKLEAKNFELGRPGREEVLRRVCVELGYCSLGETYDRLMDSPLPTISEFVDAIIVGEGLNPETTDNRLLRQIRDIVIEAVERHDGNIW